MNAEENDVERDIRQTPLYQEVESFFCQAHEPAFGKIAWAATPAASPDGREVAFTGSRRDNLEEPTRSRVCLVPVDGGPVEEVTFGPNEDRLPKWSPDGSRLAFLSDRKEKGTFALYLLDRNRLGEARPAPDVEGTAEWHAWSPDGSSILLGTAGRGAEKAGVQGSGTIKEQKQDLPSWMPTVDTGSGENQWRRAYLYDLETGGIRSASREGLNIWEADWAGGGSYLAVTSDRPEEDAWYGASLALVDVATGQERVLHRSEWQLGLPAATPSGRRLAVVEGIASDRGVMAGDLLLIDPETGVPSRLDTNGVDVTFAVWRDEDHLLFAGVRRLSSVVGEYDAATGQTRELWTSDGMCGFIYPEVSPLGADGFVCVCESYDRYPEIVLVRGGRERTITSLAHPGADFLKGQGGRIQEVSWRASDGLEIQGFLVTPEETGPFPLIVNVHGGPVSSVRNRWMGSTGAALLVSRGYAVLMPNPRGSTGRGQEFARMVYGDMVGADADDILSGVDAMVERGVADPDRVGVTGGSYGGYMSNWLITQTDRFAAAIPMHPISNCYSQHGTSNIGEFDRLFLQDELTKPGGEYFRRSPLMFASRVTTPTFQVAGGKDRCTPPTQAMEFHHALLENGVESVLVIYPEEGHGVRNMPAAIDQAARVLDWFQRHMPAGQEAGSRKEAAVAAT